MSSFILLRTKISGAMDKFTSKNEVAVNGDGGDGGGEPGVRTKRTKIVTKTRTYMEGGYMKRVNEEVEVTDDEEVMLGK